MSVPGLMADLSWTFGLEVFSIGRTARGKGTVESQIIVKRGICESLWRRHAYTLMFEILMCFSEGGSEGCWS